tara:strand:+ start:667 stop:1152 length:486 start_codon:yes stop_codon:yes gene_type:complete
MQKIGKIINQINRRRNMETETFECSFRKAFEKDNGGVTVYVTKDDGTDMTIYGEALGASRWQKGARLKIEALPVRTSKTGKQYQTANSIEYLAGEVAIPNSTTAAPVAKDPAAQWKEKYRLTMSNLLSAAIQSGKEVDFDQIDGYVRKILNAQYDGDEAPF